MSFRTAFRPVGPLALAIAVTGIATGCAAKRFLGFGGDGTLLIRHHEPASQEIWLDGELLGVVDSAAVACFRETPTGTLRVEARAATAASAPGSLTRATSVVLPPDQPRLWDVDHDQVLDGRAFLRLCS
ncbi:MAG TPA: hypothetical protein VFH11_13480 [Gemmatimonadota bacterium]|nr:hypothetical protein [Gemmatimonadota bacterium]